MRFEKIAYVPIGIISILLAAGFFSFGAVVSALGSFSEEFPVFKGTLLNTTEQDILFVGDVMLARNVEQLMTERGNEYPFSRITSLLQSYSAVVGNLESTIPEVHEQTPLFEVTFSMPEESAVALREAGFSVMTLANNHTYDFGTEGLDHTREILSKNDFAVVGNPLTLRTEDILVIQEGGYNVALISVHVLWNMLSEETVKEVMKAAEEMSDIQIVLPHWGEEYVGVGDESQQSLAHLFIDNGADAIIGHHPHVVQHIETYKDALIVYSLGNFIFDQYWNDAVQEGLMVGLAIKRDTMIYKLLPVTSSDLWSAPRQMNEAETADFLGELVEKSDAFLAGDILKGEIVLEFI